ncbi:MAG: PIN domain-containing protein [Haloarculaceae archaeon]
MTTVVDTSALLALLYPDDDHNDRAVELLSEASEAGKLTINPVVYSELAADEIFDTEENLDYFLSDTGIAVETLPRNVSFRAGQAFGTFLSRRGETLQCPACGTEITVECPDCDAAITARQHIAADFLIGAHAETAGSLLTFDSGFYRDYFDVDLSAIVD